MSSDCKISCPYRQYKPLESSTGLFCNLAADLGRGNHPSTSGRLAVCEVVVSAKCSKCFLESGRGR